jgi:hypothetical protein
VPRHIDSDNLISPAVILEIWRVVALIAVNCEQLVATSYSLLCMLTKVL